MDAQTKIARAKTRLVLEQPFWGSLTLGTPFHQDDAIPTMCTNGQWVKWGEPFVDKCTDKNVIFTTAHEIGHIVFNHCVPIEEIDGKPVDHEVHNMALDFVLNPILIDGGVGEMPEGGLYDPKYHGKSWLQVYRDLMKMDKSDRPEPQPWGGNVGSPEDKNGKPLDGAELEQHKASIAQRVFQAAQVAKAAGKLPAAIEELVKDMRQSKVDWRDVLNRFIGGEQPDDYTWRRPQKRQWFDNDIYMPSIEHMGIGDVVVAVDTSGSVATHELQQFLGELNRITEDHKPRSVTVITCDAKIQNVTHYAEGEIIETIECTGRGGTRVSPVFDYIDEHQLPVDNMVYLTDMGIGDWPSEAPHYPVLWVSTWSRCDDAPFGETTRIEVVA